MVTTATRARAKGANGEVERAAPLPRMTEQQFIDWCDEDTWAEWVDGEVILMAPISNEHDSVVVFLIRLIADFVEERELGRVLIEPFQVRFAAQRSRRAPDIMFISRAHLNRIRRIEIEGPPDLIIEIVSPDSPSRDYREKFLEYEAAGVREYWIVHPRAEAVEAHKLGTNRRFVQIREKAGKIRSRVLRGFYLRPQWLWQAKRPKITALLRELRAAK